jgi:hypothetical protein
MFFYNEEDEQSAILGDGWTLQLRQTWEPTDTDHIATGDIGTRITGGTTTTVVEHSSLSNSISFAGEKALYINSYHYPYSQQKMWANTPELVSTSQSTAVSIRVLVRDINSYGHWGIVFRNHPDGTYGSGPWYGNNSGHLWGTGLGNIQPMAPNNVWKWYRADLIPQFQNGAWVNDKLEYYIADAEENPSWSLVGEAYQTDITWDNPTYKYHMLRWHDHSQSSPNKVFWIDNLEFYTKQV